MSKIFTVSLQCYTLAAVTKYWIVNAESSIIVNVTCVTAYTLAVLSCNAHCILCLYTDLDLKGL